MKYPIARSLILTHILHVDFARRRMKPGGKAEDITASSIPFRSTSESKKMWVRISARSKGLRQHGKSGLVPTL